MPTANPEWIIDTADPEQAGLLKQFGSSVRANLPRFVRNDGVKRRLRLVTHRRIEDGWDEWDDIDKTNLGVEVAIGNPDRGAIDGTFSGKYGADAGGLVNLPFNIDGPALQVKLNSNATIAAEGGVDVRQDGTSFSVRWRNNGVRALLSFDPSNLLPRCNIYVNRVAVGAADKRETQIISIVQTPYAYNAIWSSYPVGNISMTRVQMGTSSKAEIQRLTLSEPAYKGSMFINFPRPEIVKVTCKANTATKNVTRIAGILGDDTAGGNTIGGTWFDLFGNANGTRRFWFNRGSDAAPPAPSGGSLTQMTITNNATKQAVATAITNAINAQGDFTAALKASGQGAARSYTVEVTDKNFGTRTPAEDTGATGLVITTVTAGNNGILNGKTFILYDQNGSVGYYFNVNSSVTEIPALAASCTRAVAITAINYNDTAATVAIAVAGAVDPDVEFIAVRNGNVVTVTDAVGGDRDDASPGDTGFGITKSQDGALITASVSYNASAKDMAAALGNEFLVLKSGDYTWEFTFKVKGAQPMIEVNANALFPSGFEGVLNLNTFEMFMAFQAAQSPEIDAFLEVQTTYAGELPHTVLRVPVKIVRDVINPATMVPMTYGVIPRDALPPLMTQRRSLGAGESLVVPTGYDLITGDGFTNNGSLILQGTARHIQVSSGFTEIAAVKKNTQLRNSSGADTELFIDLPSAGEYILEARLVMNYEQYTANSSVGFGVDSGGWNWVNGTWWGDAGHTGNVVSIGTGPGMIQVPYKWNSGTTGVIFDGGISVWAPTRIRVLFGDGTGGGTETAMFQGSWIRARKV